MKQVFAGSEDATRKLLQEYGGQLRKAVRMKLYRKLRPKFDSLDFVQEVWLTFFEDLANLGSFPCPGSLAKFLAKVARNKIASASRECFGQTASPRREHSLDDSRVFDKEQFPAGQPSPSVLANERNEWDDLIRSQPLAYQKILRHLRDGKTPEETARELGISPRTVRFLIKKLELRRLLCQS